MHPTHHAMRLAMRVISMTLVVAVISLLGSGLAHATPFDPDSTDWEGCSRFIEIAREELGPSRVLVVDEIDYERLGPADGLLLIHPEGSYDLDELATFMKLGGRLAIADDFGDGNRLLERFRIDRLPAPIDPLQMLHGNPQLPIAVPASGHPIVADVGQVVLNHPTVVHHPDLSALLRIPRAGGDPGPDVALAGQVGDGRLVAIGDPSIFINSMMRYPGNRALARNLVAYLLDAGGEHKREAKLVIAHDHFKERGSRGGGVTGSIRDRLRGFFSAVDSVRREGFGGIASRVVALGIATAAAIWVLLRAAFRSKIPRPRYAGADPEAAFVGRGIDDPRLSPLLETQGSAMLPKRVKITPAGGAIVHEALDAAVSAREDLRALPRPDGVMRLAVEAGLTPAEVKLVEKAFVRLRGEVGTAAVGGKRASSLSRRDAILFDRVLAPVADSLKRAR